MQMLYNSDSYSVVEIDVPAREALPAGVPESAALRRGGFEIVDKFARKEIFIEGALAQSFKEDVEALIEKQPSMEEFDDYLERFSALMQQPLILH
jgi:hypothetical protein